MPTDIKLDPITHDIDFSNGGVLHRDNATALTQRMKIAFLLRQNEWKPNTNLGVPYHQGFFSIKDNKSFIDSFFQDYALGIDEVDTVVSYSSEISDDRNLTVFITVRTTRGTIENITIGLNDGTR